VKAEPQLAHFLWAHSVYWSRAQSLPVGSSAAGSSVSAAVEDEEVVEAIVPGLDFCNHSLRPSCWWRVTGACRIAVMALPEHACTNLCHTAAMWVAKGSNDQLYIQ
jgi:hypothetical protein